MWYITRRMMTLFFWTWGPVLAAVAVMFAASAQPKYGPPEAELTSVYFSGAMPVFPGVWEVLIKKGAHVIAYGILGVMVLRALVAWEAPPRRALWLAVLLTAAYAGLDELHQAFVPGRHPSLLDIGLDFFGAVVFVAAWRWLENRREGAPGQARLHLDHSR